MKTILPEHLAGIILEHFREASGLTVAELCKEARISTKTYERLKKKTTLLW